jgi:membrane associated rhomboid family serine protease
MNYKLTKAIRIILAINIGMFIAQNVLPIEVMGHFYAWSFKSDFFNPLQIITHMFLHSSFSHIFFNMLILVFMGDIEIKLGTKRFVYMYLLSGIIGYILQSYTLPVNVPMIGASGAVFGVLGSALLLMPNTKFYVWFILPIKVKYIVPIILILEITQINSNDGVGHLCHLGGAITGFLFIFLSNLIKK